MGFDIRTSLRQRDPEVPPDATLAQLSSGICGFSLYATTMRADCSGSCPYQWKRSIICEVPNGTALCAIHHSKRLIVVRLTDENMRVIVSDAVNGGGVVQRLFRFAGKAIAFAPVKISGRAVCGMAQEEVFGREVLIWGRAAIFACGIQTILHERGFNSAWIETQLAHR